MTQSPQWFLCSYMGKIASAEGYDYPVTDHQQQPEAQRGAMRVGVLRQKKNERRPNAYEHPVCQQNNDGIPPKIGNQWQMSNQAAQSEQEDNTGHAAEIE